METVQASQTPDEEWYNNQGCIESCQLDRGSFDEMIGGFMQSIEQDTQEVQSLQQAHIGNWEAYMCGFSDLGCVGFRFFAFGGGSDDNVWGFSNLGCGFYGGGPVLCLEVVYGFCDWRWL
ncbi:hypothetical protein LWI29_020491 [Acer saccharum]|uniref:Uncharacterized protein n=1 Tax=Acer saccharum TaxID=4024 RepID=A0AA39RVL7_ACESA|nr:hypothetical protein LWI29_020491 [Acer saccharum]